jgi:hypothetical protein
MKIEKDIPMPVKVKTDGRGFYFNGHRYVFLDLHNEILSLKIVSRGSVYNIVYTRLKELSVENLKFC